LQAHTEQLFSEPGHLIGPGGSGIMIEIALSLVMLAAAVLAHLGFAEGLIPIPIGLITIALAAPGLIFACHGVFRVLLKRGAESRHWIRVNGLMWLMLALTACIAFAIPLFAPAFNAFKLAGFPLGFYLAAQGAPILLVILLFTFSSHADLVDEQEGARED
jgi:putative solute:sodium symporter small subunit